MKRVTVSTRPRKALSARRWSKNDFLPSFAQKRRPHETRCRNKDPFAWRTVCDRVRRWGRWMVRRACPRGKGSSNAWAAWLSLFGLTPPRSASTLFQVIFARRQLARCDGGCPARGAGRGGGVRR